MPFRLRVRDHLCIAVFPADDCQSVYDHGTLKRNYLSFKDLPPNLSSKEMETSASFHLNLLQDH